MKKYTRNEVEEIVKSAEASFAEFLAKQAGEKDAENLSKAEDNPFAEKDESKDEEESKDDSKEESKGNPFAEASPETEKVEPLPEESKEESEEDSKEDSKGDGDPKEEGKPDLDAMYAGMDKGELGSHYKACKKAMWKHMASAAVAKSEDKPSDDLRAKVEELSKSLESFRKENDELKKVQDETGKVFELLVRRPSRKAVVSADQIVGKPGDGRGAEAPALSKAELDSRLTELTRSDRLTVKERDEINRFYLEGSDRGGVIKIIADKQEAK